MSKKYYDKLMTGSGSTTKAVKSKFGSKMLAAMGWETGKGLGANEDGRLECIQVKRREEGVGLGQDAGEDGGLEKVKVNGIDKKEFKWNDSFWTNMYNGAV